MVEVVALLAALGAAVAVLRSRARRGAVDDLAAFAQALGLVRAPAVVGETWTATRGDVTLTLRRVEGRTTLTCGHATPSRVSLGVDGALERPLRGPDVKTHDASFDAAVRVAGDEAEVLAALDPATRDRVQRAASDGWHADDGEWTLRVSGAGLEDVRAAVDDLIVPLAARLARPRDAIVDRLVARLRDADEHDAVKARLLAALVKVGDDAAPQLARVVASPIAPRLRAEALAAMAAGHRHHGETIAAVMLFVAAAERIPSELATATARALASVPVEDCEGALLRLLAHAERDVKLAAIEGLRARGTIARAVPVLVPLRDRTFAGELGERAGAAIAAIRQRAGDVAAGRLAIADPGGDGGGLTLSEAERAIREPEVS